MTNLLRIKQACWYNDKSIKELKLGCKAMYDSKTVMNWIHYGPDYDNFDGCDCHQFMKPDGTRLFLSNSSVEGYEILGRPISLADVLGVIKYRYMKGILQKEGEFRNLGEWYSQICLEWNLALDLDHQPPETIDLIASLLPIK